jgi:hypothetical protein
MHQRAGRAMKAVLEGDVDESIRNEAAWRLARIFMQKGDATSALGAIERIKAVFRKKSRTKNYCCAGRYTCMSAGFRSPSRYSRESRTKRASKAIRTTTSASP